MMEGAYTYVKGIVEAVVHYGVDLTHSTGGFISELVTKLIP